MKQQQKLAPVGVYQSDDKITFNKKGQKVPLEYTLNTYIRKGKDYPYNSTKRGALKVDVWWSIMVWIALRAMPSTSLSGSPTRDSTGVLSVRNSE